MAYKGIGFPHAHRFCGLNTVIHSSHNPLCYDHYATPYARIFIRCFGLRLPGVAVALNCNGTGQKGTGQNPRATGAGILPAAFSPRRGARFLRPLKRSILGPLKKLPD